MISYKYIADEEAKRNIYRIFQTFLTCLIPHQNTLTIIVVWCAGILRHGVQSKTNIQFFQILSLKSDFSFNMSELY